MIVSRCKFKWEAYDGDSRVYCECIRKPDHEGNHVSYPSGEELKQVVAKKPKEKSIS